MQIPVNSFRLQYDFWMLKWREKIDGKNSFEQKKQELGLRFNLGLAIVGFRTTGRRNLAHQDSIIFGPVLLTWNT